MRTEGTTVHTTTVFAYESELVEEQRKSSIKRFRCLTDNFEAQAQDVFLFQKGKQWRVFKIFRGRMVHSSRITVNVTVHAIRL